MDGSILTPMAALFAGLATSLHCTAMCGPLACALRVNPVEYHLGRLVSYTAAGAAVGAVGGGIVDWFQGDTARILPWVLAGVLVMLAFGLEKRLPQPRFLTKFIVRARLNRSLGWLTPLLPCGPLWLMLGAAALAGSWHGGAILMACFVAGTIPLPFFLQSQAARIQMRISPRALRWTQQFLALGSAAILVWRANLPLHACCCH